MNLEQMSHFFRMRLALYRAGKARRRITGSSTRRKVERAPMQHALPDKRANSD